MPQTRLTEDSVADEQDALLAAAAGARARRRRGVGQARPRPAAGAARGRRGRRRRLRARRSCSPGVVAALRGDAPPPLEHHAPARVTHPAAPLLELPLLHELRGHRRATSTPAPWIEALEEIGDSVLVVGDAHTLKVHVHTDDPEEATRLFDGTARGLAPRRRRHAAADGAARRRGSATAAARRRTCGALAVVSGEGMAELFALARRDAARRRPDAQPLHLRPAGGHPRRPGRGGRRAAQLART